VKKILKNFNRKINLFIKKKFFLNLNFTCIPQQKCRAKFPRPVGFLIPRNHV